MRRAFLFIALFALCATIKFHGKRNHHKNNFDKFVKRLKHFTKEQFGKFQFDNLSEKKFNKKTHSQSEIVKKVNRLKTTWTAIEYKRDYRPFIGAILDGLEALPEKQFTEIRNDLPEQYDPREVFPDCESIKEVRETSTCSAAWAFGAVDAMSDRICIKSGQKEQTRVSFVNLITCCTKCGSGCYGGGFPSFVWDYWKDTGICTGGNYGDNRYCQPDYSPEETPEEECVKNCDRGNKKNYEDEMTYGTSAYSVSGEENIMQEIYENGPVEASFSVYEDFAEYQNGVYQHVTGSLLGGHAVKMIGWGVENGVKYWLCVNSWGKTWGDKGLFKILRGNNECGIESNINAGLPK